MKTQLFKFFRAFLYMQAILLAISVFVGVVSGLYLGLTENPIRDQVIKEAVERGWLDSDGDD
jgi:hypothetical protein